MDDLISLKDRVAMAPSRLVGVSSAMAGAATFLASRAGDCVVGSAVVVDGGAAATRQVTG